MTKQQPDTNAMDEQSRDGLLAELEAIAIIIGGGNGVMLGEAAMDAVFKARAALAMREASGPKVDEVREVTDRLAILSIRYPKGTVGKETCEMAIRLLDSLGDTL